MSDQAMIERVPIDTIRVGKRRLQQDGFIYFIQAIDGGPIKIGYTDSMAGRLASIQAMSPVLVRFIGCLRGSVATEHELHRMFSASRLHGEWFSPSPDLLDFITAKSASMVGREDPKLAGQPWTRRELWSYADYKAYATTLASQADTMHWDAVGLVQECFDRFGRSPVIGWPSDESRAAD